MILVNGNYERFIYSINKNDKKVIVYGAGMIGQIVIPFLIQKYNIGDRIVCFIDADSRKRKRKIVVEDYQYSIYPPEYLKKIGEDFALLITNSKFFPIIDSLSNLAELENIEYYIVPIMQKHEFHETKDIEIKRYTFNQRIPQKIHFCWFGKNEMPTFLSSCISSWKNQCPKYEVICWNEDNYDIQKHNYTKQAYEVGKYGFVSDLARLDILYEYGGIYMDTDVTVEKSLDDLLYQDGFIGVEKWGNINTGGCCGFVKEHPMLKELIDYRDKYSFILEDGSLNIETNGLYESTVFQKYGFRPDNSLQKVNGVTVYPSYVFHPYDYMSGEWEKRDATYCSHHFFGGWMEEDDKRIRAKTMKKYVEFIKQMS